MSAQLSRDKDRVRLAAEADLEVFIKLVAPYRVLGSIHKEVIEWWTREDALKNQLLLLPRDHMKSALLAYRCAWIIANRPDVRILYISSTANLAEKQLKFIKDILTSDIFMYYWPGHVNSEEGKRAKWTSSEIEVDHPLRLEEGIRDPTICTGGLTTSLTGLHFDILALDDIVVYENAYTAEGRGKVSSQCSLLVSIASADAEVYVTGTRYDPNDQYGKMIEMEYEVHDFYGSVIDKQPIYEVFSRQVESLGDGTGVFLWPRQVRGDGKWFGFDREILSKKRAQYTDTRQYRAQYYNDPNDLSNAPIDGSNFQYYDKKFVSRSNGYWFYQDRRLNVYASIDFAFSLTKKADYTAIVVIGVDWDNNIYVLDIERIKTDKVSEYYKLIRKMHVKWDFRKLRAETTAGQKVIVKSLKNDYIRPEGLSLSVDENSPTRHQGAKDERIQTILEPKYSNLQMWHYRGGECQTLEEELILERPPHKDIKDALASVVEIANPPVHSRQVVRAQSNVVTHPRFGGVSF